MSLDCSSLDPISSELMQTYLLTSRPIFAKKRPSMCLGIFWVTKLGYIGVCRGSKGVI